MDDTSSIRLRAFVGRSFLPQDEQVWVAVRKILEALRPVGLHFDEASEAQLRTISDKVRSKLEHCSLYIGILTRRFPIYAQQPESGEGLFKRVLAAINNSQRPSKWGTSAWIVEEIGFALGSGKKALLLVEEGVEFPQSDLAGDMERVFFDRRSMQECSTRLTAMINNLIAEQLPSVPQALQVTSPPPAPSSESLIETRTDTGSFQRVRELLNRHEFEGADKALDIYITDHLGCRELVQVHIPSVESNQGA